MTADALEAKKTLDSPDIGRVLDELRRGERRGKGPRIRCPRCAWSPRAHDRWQCWCGHVWNTFETRGVCPSCAFRHLDTMCLACERWSKHAAWYTNEDER